jgi:hypothetical protein
MTARSWKSSTPTAVRLAPVLEQPDDERSGRQSDGEAPSDRLRPRQAEGAGQQGGRQRGHAVLQSAAAKHRGPHAPQIAQRDLEADHKQQQHHAHLGDNLDLVAVTDQPEAGGADDHTRQDEPDNRRHCQPPQQQRRGNRHRHHEHDLGEHSVHQILSNLARDYTCRLHIMGATFTIAPLSASWVPIGATSTFPQMLTADVVAISRRAELSRDRRGGS